MLAVRSTQVCAHESACIMSLKVFSRVILPIDFILKRTQIKMTLSNPLPPMQGTSLFI